MAASRAASVEAWPVVGQPSAGVGSDLECVAGGVDPHPNSVEEVAPPRERVPFGTNLRGWVAEGDRGAENVS